MRAKCEICRMDLLIVAATKLEIAPFLATNHTADVLITGAGIPSTIFNLSHKLLKTNYDLVIQAGIAGTFNGTFEKTDPVIIKEDTFADIGAIKDQNFQTLFDMGLANENDFPYQSGWLKNETKFLKNVSLPLATAITINTITDDKTRLKQLQEKFHPDVESMEGAAFHYVCLQQKVNFLQLRSISNIVGDRDKTKWKIDEAITSLSTSLQKLIQNFT